MKIKNCETCFCQRICLAKYGNTYYLAVGTYFCEYTYRAYRDVLNNKVWEKIERMLKSYEY